MRRFFYLSLVLLAFGQPRARAQGFYVTFDTLSLPGNDTFYANYSQPGQDVGFYCGPIYFPSVFDTSAFGPFWNYGFSYSNKTDTSTPGYTNDRAAITGIGYNNSPNYCIVWQGYSEPRIRVGGLNIQSLYVTNTTYAYLSMRDGDGFAKKFGGATGNDPDWFKVSFILYLTGGGVDTVHHYLADFRFQNNAFDYIQKDWEQVNFNLGTVDSIGIKLSSSDTGAFGMNTPAYLALDQLYFEQTQFVPSQNAQTAPVQVYPNPTNNDLIIEAPDAASFAVIDCFGNRVLRQPAAGRQHLLPTCHLTPGAYLLEVTNKKGERAFMKFSKN